MITAEEGLTGTFQFYLLCDITVAQGRVLSVEPVDSMGYHLEPVDSISGSFDGIALVHEGSGSDE